MRDDGGREIPESVRLERLRRGECAACGKPLVKAPSGARMCPDDLKRAQHG